VSTGSIDPKRPTTAMTAFAKLGRFGDHRRLATAGINNSIEHGDLERGGFPEFRIQGCRSDMTEKISLADTPEAAAAAAELQDGTGASAAGVDAVAVVSLALSASDPAVARELSGFLNEQRELAGRQRLIADKQSKLLDHRLERVGLESSIPCRARTRALRSRQAGGGWPPWERVPFAGAPK
jgi:hypothetical protein